MRQRIVAGNWKMNNTLEEGLKLASEVAEINEAENTQDVEVILCTPYLHLTGVGNLLNGKSVKLGSQNCHQNESGAYTGEISAGMLKSAGVDYVIIGHSERREYFQETDEQLAEKVNVVLEHNMIPIFCCGETLDIREGGQHVEFVSGQLRNSLFHLSEESFSKIVIAYEPIWAIGTGVTASPEQAQEMHAALRGFLSTRFEAAKSCPILYGGSCKPSNAAELFALEDVDGGLIGGASLNSRDFLDIVKSF